jgi:LysM repeat protein
MPEGGGGGGSFLQKKFLGIPAIVWMAGAALLAYMYFRSHSSGSTGSGVTPNNANNGTATTGDTTFPNNPTNITINSQYHQSGSASSTSGSPPPRHTTPNPQPTPKTKPPVKKHAVAVKVPGKSVTVGSWPGHSGTTGHAAWNTTVWGIAQHYDITIEELLKLNPQIKNANLIYPGEKIKV